MLEENKNLKNNEQEKDRAKIKEQKKEAKAKKKEEKEKNKKEKQNKEPGKVRKFFQKIGRVLSKKWLVNGTKTILLVAIIILLYIGVNILLENVVLPEIDCTTDKIYSLSDESRDKVGNIDKDVTITLINYSSNTSIMNFMEKYKSLNDHITIEEVNDLSARTDLMTEYSLEADDSLIIVSSGDNEKQVSQYDMYTYDYSTYETIDTTEEAITNAILDVTTEEKPKIYFMNNHLMYDIQYYSTVMQAMEDEANEVDTVDILQNGGVPEDCDTLVLTTLREDISEQERDAIIEYIKNGGEILLMCGPNLTGVDLSNFQTVLDEYGVSISDGVIFEGSSANMISGYPDFIVETTENTSLTENLNMSMNICFIDAGKITFDEDKLEELGVEYENLVQTTDSAFVRTNTSLSSVSRTDEDEEPESSTIAAIATKTIDDSTTSKLIVFSNELFAMDMPVQINGYTMYTVSLYNNEDMLLNSVSYLNEREDTITIRKTSEEVTYTVTEQQNIIIMTIIFAVPVLLIIIGIVVWQVRRRKK